MVDRTGFDTGLKILSTDFGLKILGLVVLALVFLFVLTWAGIVQCKGISPYWCDAYDFVVGSPRVLVVYGESGLGNPDQLVTYLKDPRYVGAMAVDSQTIDMVSLGNLKRYKLVVVEHARLLSADQLQMFRDYVSKNGGRLVWIGDAGTQRPDGELAGLVDSNSGKALFTNPWARVIETEDTYDIVSFDEFLGLRYQGNYCTLVTCSDEFFPAGLLKPEPSGEHPLIFGTASVLPFKIRKEHDFAVVKQIPSSANSNLVLNLEFGGLVYTKDSNIGRSVPLIATSGVGVGGAERVAYYAYPPEWFLEDNNYFYYIKNMYYGMLGR